MLCHITCVILLYYMLRYTTKLMLYDICYGMLYNISYVMLYNMCYVVLCYII